MSGRGDRQIIVWMRNGTLLERLRALAEAPPHGPGALSLAEVEYTLTDGYAHALSLEAESARLSRQIVDLAARAGELASVRYRVSELRAAAV
jgi:hypothetical protein